MEPRRLLALGANWIGQVDQDFVGTEGTIAPAPNDYRDFQINVTGLSGTISQVDVFALGKGWTWAPNFKTLVVQTNSQYPGQANFFMDPQVDAPSGTTYSVNVKYTSGQTESINVLGGNAVVRDSRMPGKQLQATFHGQESGNKVDLTGMGPGAGSDNFQDVRLRLNNLSQGGELKWLTITADGRSRTWGVGANSNGEWNAELVNRSGSGASLGTTADLYFSSDLNLGDPAYPNRSITVRLEYSHMSGGAYTNREYHQDVFTISAASLTATTPSQAMPAAPESNLPEATAVSTPQDSISPGLSHVSLYGDSLNASAQQSLANLRSATLSNRHGQTWTWTWSATGGSGPLSYSYAGSMGSFAFEPVRDEEGSTLTLLLGFANGSQAVARFAGAKSDVNRTSFDSRANSTEELVTDVAGLLSKISAQRPWIKLAATTFQLTQPLTLNYPVRITAAPGATLSFTPSASWLAENDYNGAIRLKSDHITLDGFAVRFQGDTSNWPGPADKKVVIQGKTDTNKVDIALVNLDIQGPASPSGFSGYELAPLLMYFDPGDKGLIANNLLKGGPVHVGHGPWTIVDNRYVGTPAKQGSSAFLSAHTLHDLVVRGNDVRQLDPAGATLRFFTFGMADTGQALDVLIEDNKVYGGVGTPAAGSIQVNGLDNGPEIMMFESYAVRFEGKPSSISPDGYIVQVPNLRGAESGSGDVISILTGPYAGQWRTIAQRLGPRRYLLNEPLPVGDYVISIGRGAVDVSIRRNLIDTTGMNSSNVGLVLTGFVWNATVLDNTFKGNMSLRLLASGTETIVVDPSVVYPAVWGWSLRPLFDVAVIGNTFDNSPTEAVQVDHNYKSTVGRTYLTGSFSNNRILQASGGATAVRIGRTGFVSQPWLSAEAIQMTVAGNWWGNPQAGAAPTILVNKARINGAAVTNTSTSVATADAFVALARGQDGRDYIGVGSSSSGPDGFQDLRFVLSGLPSSKAVSYIEITHAAGGLWRYQGTGGVNKAVFVRSGTTGDLYIQPPADDSNRTYTIKIYYTDNTLATATVAGVYSTASLPTPSDRATPSGAVTARGENTAGGQGASKAFDGNASTKWVDFSGTSWIQYQFASGQAFVVTQYTITSASDAASYPERAPSQWILRGSNDGVNWTPLDSRYNEAIVTNSTSRTYRFSNQTAFKYYKFDTILANKDIFGFRGTAIQVGEIELGTTQVLAIKAGSASVAGWGDDAGYASGGNFYSTGQPIDTSGVDSPAPQSVYQTERNGNFTYTLTGLLAGGKYTIRLHFAEIFYNQAGKRTFNVLVNGVLGLDHFDVFAAAGAMNKAVIRELPATADSLGRITVTLDGTGQPDIPKVSGIEVVIPAVDLARGKVVRSSFDESTAYGPSNVVDGNPTTRWSSGQWTRNNQVAWLVIDLGAVYDVDRVQLDWETAFGVDYMIQFSDDGLSWHTARSVTGASVGGVVQHSNLNARGRFVRIYLTKSRINPTNNYSLYSVNIYGA